MRAYLLKEAFQQLWDYNSPAWAGKFLDQWCQDVMRSRIEPMKKVAATLRNHRELILNYFRARKRFSSGVVEGLNNKAKVTMRKSYGFRTFRVTELASYHALGKLPAQPDWALHCNRCSGPCFGQSRNGRRENPLIAVGSAPLFGVSATKCPWGRAERPRPLH